MILLNIFFVYVRNEDWLVCVSSIAQRRTPFCLCVFKSEIYVFIFQILKLLHKKVANGATIIEVERVCLSFFYLEIMFVFYI